MRLARVLIVEDYPPLAKVIAIAIHRAGHGVERVGGVARALATQGFFDLAVIDLDLPDGVGTELAARLLDERRLRAPLFFTSTRDHELRAQAERLGRVVHKESGIEELMVWVAHESDQQRSVARAVGAEEERPVSASGRSGTRKRVPG